MKRALVLVMVGLALVMVPPSTPTAEAHICVQTPDGFPCGDCDPSGPFHVHVSHDPAKVCAAP